MQNVYRRSIRNKKLLRADTECYCNYVLLYIMEIDVSILLIGYFSVNTLMIRLKYIH